MNRSNNVPTDAEGTRAACKARRKARLAVEFAALFVGLPVAFYLWLQPNNIPVIPVLVVVALFCLLTLLRSPDFDRRCLWNAAAVRGQLRRIFTIYASVVFLLTAFIAATAPGILFFLPREQTLLWALIMFVYPALSVYPQELIYRAFLFHRYDPIFPSASAKILASALAFGFVHIVFRNNVALVMTMVGGLFFAITYRKSRSLAAVWLEHALYGWFIFTVGLGKFFFVGTAALVARMMGHGG